MKQFIPKVPAEFLMPLNMNGLRGRMLRMPPPAGKSRELLFVYGHHASIERYYGLMEAINDHIGVTLPDLPGFGGMDSFYTIGEEPTLDNMADYLAAFVKLRYNHRKRFSIAGASYGFLVVTRMLQRYPDIADRVDMVMSLVGFAHHDDFAFTPRRMRIYKIMARMASGPVMSKVFRGVFLSPFVLRRTYSKMHNAKHKFADLSPEEARDMTEFEIHLWRSNDARTHANTTTTMFTVDNCQARVKHPVWHVYTKTDNYFDYDVVEQHMRVIFTDFHPVEAKLKNHMPTVLAGKEAAAQLIPYRLRQQLAKKL
jgi:pimeloyl-ACP methyl ester carboxylesterase